MKDTKDGTLQSSHTHASMAELSFSALRSSYFYIGFVPCTQVRGLGKTGDGRDSWSQVPFHTFSRRSVPLLPTLESQS